MSVRRKTLGLGIVAILAVGVIGVVNASAETGGHFTAEKDHVTLTGAQISSFNVTWWHGENAVECQTVSVGGTVSSATTTVTEATIVPTAISGCRLEPLPSVSVSVTTNECHFIPRIGKKAAADNTLSLTCPNGSAGIVLHWSIFLVGSCTVTFKPQTAAGGVSYGTGGSAGATHDILAKLTLSNTHTVYHQTGLGCAGTSGTVVGGNLNGEVTVRGFEGVNQVGITATGSED